MCKNRPFHDKKLKNNSKSNNVLTINVQKHPLPHVQIKNNPNKSLPNRAKVLQKRAQKTNSLEKNTKMEERELVFWAGCLFRTKLRGEEGIRKTTTNAS
ncbi:MAG: hypothetical protein A3G33_11255 [Omnitrophica bacterium RIFCSPLOWO2_12_FULL_44_17]|uniref:Uncharacterized protein n=1 Tax=Candidatus Danuiimicrobium aquiferis TaxID=1801832 RepID=A0A1G1KRJ2_9BACT|nr:MAG: hypothetical protein A3B72_09090 [Omnitrophica bacterium RIFCSPHIGHO2_02_FULL_45_28]OGW88349.1 MAG: hypothetical protein A3E74_10590 [Omnitrophica bacterium RIFCSPHIGHO2_12_FULL_44_12]OGW95574.1 MAG: hypothetical protein A3G33_11255 [Omnitrophica bacterium RIFCSPLOWO2_12_FULL_44_17]OGX03711.1 MAG: hypothetical protein A3J12_01235 [Omnitrophica bacterium RIFCSPLOWO2_02_FULL_44_11]